MIRGGSPGIPDAFPPAPSQPFFSPDWADAAACTFRNAVAAAVASLPPPALLSLDAARAARDELKARVAALEGQLSAATAALAAATAVEEDQAEEGDGDDGGAWRPGGGGSGDGGGEVGQGTGEEGGGREKGGRGDGGLR